MHLPWSPRSAAKLGAGLKPEIPAESALLAIHVCELKRWPMNLEWQQKQLLKLLHDMDAFDQGTSIVARVEASGAEKCFHIVGSKRASDETGIDVDKKYLKSLVYSLKDAGYVGLDMRGSEAFQIWVTPAGLAQVGL
jgi:hypothetical protein